ncbi:MAG: hypothetical protein J5825_03600 [Lachnospiraceae bacterium]|nr:hypothetical protein [Lachnospiraceae bacterium]
MKKIKKLGRSAYVLSVVLFIAGIFCLLLTFSGWRAFFPKVDLSELTAQTQMKEKTVVGGKITALVDCPVVGDEGKFYLAPCGTEDYVLIYVSDKDGKKFEALCDETVAVLFGEKDSITSKPITLRGYRPEMKAASLQKVMDITEEWFEDSGFADAYIEGDPMNHVVPYVLVHEPVAKWFGTRDYILLIVGLVIFACSIANTFYVLTGRNLKKAKAVFLADGLGDADLEAETADAEVIKGTHVMLTPRYVIYTAGSDVVAVHSNNVIWAYMFHQITQHKLYGIVPMGKTHQYSVRYVVRNGNVGEIQVGGAEKTAQKVIEELGNKYPQIITEQSDRIFKLASQDFGALLRESEVKRQRILGITNDTTNNEPEGSAHDRVTE